MTDEKLLKSLNELLDLLNEFDLDYELDGDNPGLHLADGNVVDWSDVKQPSEYLKEGD